MTTRIAATTLSRTFKRRMLSLVVSEEIKQALNDKSLPVVSLESTIITHGLPHPNNLEMARSVESIIRKEGGIPATCAFIDGVPHVGLNDKQLERLASADKVNKVSRRDIGYTMANKINGGTTIALTMILSHMAGIQVFATGGLGGVHKDGQLTFDVSADLTELGRTPVTVVCAGPKSILDIGLTMEYLETQGVFVLTYNEDSKSDIQIPGFYCRESGVLSPYSFGSFSEIANTIYQHNNVMNLKSGNVICIPPPHESALSSDFINDIVSRANEEAVKLGVRGKELTPFLLSKIAQETQGRSVNCNIEFVSNNARTATKIARELLDLENKHVHQYVKGTKENTTTSISSKSSTNNIFNNSPTKSTVVNNIPTPPVLEVLSPHVDTLVIGSVAVDTISTVGGMTKQQDSNPGSIRTSIGGVGFNINLACYYANNGSSNTRGTNKLVSLIGDDMAGKTILKQMEQLGLDTSGILVQQGSLTAQYASTHGSSGDLIIAVADMKIVELLDFAEHIIQQVKICTPKQIVFDCNLSPEVISKVLSHIEGQTEVIIDPTSFAKASRIAKVNLGVFPHNSVKLIAPTVNELESLFEESTSRGLFEDYDLWFPVLDSLGINSAFREKLVTASRKHKVLEELMQKGSLQQSFQLLPYYQNILLKVGDKGVVLISLSTSIDDWKSIPTSSYYKPDIIMCSQGHQVGNGRMGVVVEYFPIPPENTNLEIRNVTGAGDSFLGYLVAQLPSSQWHHTEIELVEQVWSKWELIYKAQLASGESLKSDQAISSEISRI